MKQLNRILCLMILLISSYNLYAQPSFNMSNTTTNECEGILMDSDMGLLPDTYDNNENFTFKICIPGAEKIVFSFATFCTEEQYDYIRFFDGPDTLSPLIAGPFSGTMLPPQITAKSGCLTISFISDANLQCTGWIASWKVEIDEPVAPKMNVVGTVPCESGSLTLQLDQKIPCDSIYPAAFLMYGPQSPTIISATPVGCVGGMTDKILLSFAPTLKVNGNYTVNFTTTFLDVCHKPHILTTNANFNVSGCPLFVQLTPENNKGTVCPGECLKLYATITGGDPGSYNIKWSDPKLPNSAAVDVCVPGTTYSVTVTDGIGSSPAIATFTFQLYSLPVISWPLGDTICQSEASFNLVATPAGGTWEANGINNKNQTPAWYEPGRDWQGSDKIIYIDKNGCRDTQNIVVKLIWIFNDDASCPGATPFTVSGWSPAGGTWSGNNITSNGVFDPIAPGNFLITYNAPNGCSQSKNIRVADLVMPPDITICSSKDPFGINVVPWGGNWTPSPGLDKDWSWFEPAKANPGLNKLHYFINGCEDSMSIYIVPVTAKGDFVACTNGVPFIVPDIWGPAGGVWSGKGIIDSLTGMFDPSLVKSGQNITLTYTVNGCSDSRIAYIRDTKIKQKVAKSFCTDSDPIHILTSEFAEEPGGGKWTGTGIYYVYIKDKDPKNGYYFDPKISGAGIHSIVYTANSCTDTVLFTVHALPMLDSLSLCLEENPTMLKASEPINIWTGTGIINGFGGIFDPKVAGVGIHTITMTSVAGCINTGVVEVYPFQKVSIQGLNTQYCFKDTTINIQYGPLGGTLLVDGIAQTTFNPTIAGPGTHTIKYSYGSGKCADSKLFIVNVGNPVGVDLPFVADSICLGESSKISAQGKGGSSFGNYNYTWDQNVGFGQTQFVFPTVSTSYTVTVTDGCSEPAKASINILVHPQFITQEVYGPNVCFGDTTFTTLQTSPIGNYTYTWLTNPVFQGDTYNGNPANYLVQIVNNITGCKEEEYIELKGYDLIQANFNVSPNENCISSLDGKINIIDYSVGAKTGTWDFGDGQTQDYIYGQELTHHYADTGQYVIHLYIENEGACKSDKLIKICIRPEETLFAPNAFTPNSNNINNKFKFVGLGIRELDWRVFNRWGEMVFYGNTIDAAWDGRYQGKPVPGGVYTYIAVYKTETSNQEQIKKGIVSVIY